MPYYLLPCYDVNIDNILYVWHYLKLYLRYVDNQHRPLFLRMPGSYLDKPRRVFNPNDTCYECGERGHYAYDCPKRQGGRSGGGRGGGGGGSRGGRNMSSGDRFTSRSTDYGSRRRRF